MEGIKGIKGMERMEGMEGLEKKRLLGLLKGIIYFCRCNGLPSRPKPSRLRRLSRPTLADLSLADLTFLGNKSI